MEPAAAAARNPTSTTVTPATRTNMMRIMTTTTTTNKLAQLLKISDQMYKQNVCIYLYTCFCIFITLYTYLQTVICKYI